MAKLKGGKLVIFAVPRKILSAVYMMLINKKGFDAHNSGPLN